LKANQGQWRGICETPRGSFVCTDSLFTLERQRVRELETWTKEPLAKDDPVVFYLEGFGRRWRMGGGLVESSKQLAQGQGFYSLIYGLEGRILGQPVTGQLLNLDRVAGHAGVAAMGLLAFQSLVTPGAEIKSLVLYGSLRNALDQLRLCYSLTAERWHIDVQKKTLILTPGRLPGTPLTTEIVLLKEETEEGLEMGIVPSVRPFLSWLHRNELLVVDKVIFDQKRQSMFVRLNDE